MKDWRSIKAPKGAEVYNCDTTYMTVIKPDDTFVERLCMKYRGHDVQIHRHDRDDKYWIVFIDDKVPEMLHPGLVDAWIETYTL